MTRRRAVSHLIDAFREHHLLNHASAISFQAIFALLPVTLVAVALLGFFDLSSVWTRDVAPDLRDQVSPAAFSVIDQAVTDVLDTHRGAWLTAGVLFTTWKLTSAGLTVATAVNAVHDLEDDRPLPVRARYALAAGAVVAATLIAATAIVRLGATEIESAVGPVLAALVAWLLALGLMLIAAGALLKLLPARPVHWRWAGRGALIVVGSWAVISLGFGAYALSLSAYGSLFGGISVLFALLLYIYLSSCAFLVGVALEASGEG